MNKTILSQAIEQVKSIYTPPETRCSICLLNNAEIPCETTIDIISIPTEIGINVCRICFDNILIAAGELEQEY